MRAAKRCATDAVFAEHARIARPQISAGTLSGVTTKSERSGGIPPADPERGALFLFRFGVMARMVLCGLARVMRRMQGVRVRTMRVVGGFLMRASRIMRCGLFMMLRRMLVMLGGLGMVLLCGMFRRHADLPVCLRRSSQGAGRR